MSGSAPARELRGAFALLAAGKGERFGGGKLTVDLGGKPLWRWAADSAVLAGMSELLVVTNDAQIAREATAAGWIVHPNQAADEGVASSIRIAACAAASSRRLVIALADMPFVEVEHLRRLASGKDVAFTSQLDGRVGVPAAFPSEAYPQLIELAGNRGAASVPWPNRICLDPASPDSLLDVDTEADLERARTIAVRLQLAASR